MKKLDLNALGVEEMNVNEVMTIDGGSISIIRITGVLDGIKHNTHLYLFGIRIF